KFQEDVWLNVTGGTKLMALAAYEAFVEKDRNIIYCNTKHKHIISLYPDYKIETLNADLSIPDYLLSYGFAIKGEKDIKEVEKYFPLIEFINKNNLMNEFVIFFKEIREKLTDDIPRITMLSENKNFVFYKNYDKYTIEYNTTDKNKISIDSFEFRLGDWLEYYTYYNLKKCDVQSLLTGVKIVSQDNTENEIDVIVLKDFVLHIYSCKSGNSNNQFDLFQLETLRNITSGTFGKGYFVVSKKCTKRFLDRAKELNIRVINILNQNENFI
uniref:Card1-like endonuclease domain-containing protein n=1 Tax=Ignavibacterium sp. TaxID=2651167 RepID=UPI00307E3081